MPTWPSFTTNIALQFFTVLSLWAMVMLVLPSWALSRALRTVLSLSVSRAEVASSSNRTGGFLIKARAMAILCFWPGEWRKSLLLFFEFYISYPQRAGYPSLPQEFRSPEMILNKRIPLLCVCSWEGKLFDSKYVIYHFVNLLHQVSVFYWQCACHTKSLFALQTRWG